MVSVKLPSQSFTVELEVEQPSGEITKSKIKFKRIRQAEIYKLQADLDLLKEKIEAKGGSINSISLEAYHRKVLENAVEVNDLTLDGEVITLEKLQTLDIAPEVVNALVEAYFAALSVSKGAEPKKEETSGNA